MQESSLEIGKTQRTKISRQHILDCYESKHVKVVDLTGVLAKYPEIFSISVFEPECKKASDFDPNDALVSITSQTKKQIPIAGIPAKPKLVIPKSPFSKSGFADDLTLRAWYYLDEQDKVQGPFTSLEMDNWYDQGYFFNELLIRFKNNQFYKLIELFGKFPTNSAVNTPITRAVDKKSPNETQSEVNEKRGLSTQEDGASKNELLRETEENANLQKRGSKRGSKRMSVEDAPVMMQKNIWENFIDKKKETEPKSETIITRNLGDSMQTTDSKKQQETTSSEKKEASQGNDSKHKDNKSSEASESDSAKKKKKKAKRKQSDSDSGDGSDRKKEKTPKTKKKNSREYIEYLPKDESTRSEKAPQEIKSNETKTPKKGKEDSAKEYAKKEGESNQKSAKNNEKNKTKNKGQRRQSMEIDSSNSGDSKHKGTSVRKGSFGQQQPQNDLSDSLPTKNHHEQKTQQTRNQKKQGKYVVVFEPKLVAKADEEKFAEKANIEEKQNPVLLSIDDHFMKSGPVTQDFSLVGTEDFLGIEHKCFIENGMAFLPRPVTHSRFEKLFKEKSLQVTQ